MRLPVLIWWKTSDGREGVFDSRDCEDYVYTVPVENGIPEWFWFEEGNGACDCNRASIFLNEENWPCGHTIEITKKEVIA